MLESDWKKFTVIKELALESFCKSSLDQAEKISTDSNKTYHERYIALYQLMISKDKKIAHAFNGHSRSSAWLQLLAMRRLNLVPDEALSELSEDFQKHTNPIK